MSSASRLATNFHSILKRLEEAAHQQGRDPSGIQLVAVTKYVDFETTWQLAELGCQHLGESRPQQLAAKVEAARQIMRQSPGGPSPQWHLIGHLQRNKARRAWQDADWIHSVDSLRLLKTLAALAEETNRQPRLLLEVNCSGDATKHGFPPADMPATVDALASLPLTICGLMTMASREGGREQARQNFAQLRELRDQLLPRCPTNVQLKELSMGMSGDWEEAVAEGATMVRIGSALFQ